jgi:PAS domain S-box-containing protein
MRPDIWKWYLAVATIAAVTAGVVTGAAADAILLAAVASTLAAGAFGVRAHRPAHLRFWLLLGVTFTWWGVAAATGSSATGNLVSLEFLPAYVFLVAAACDLLHTTGRVPFGRADAFIALLALTALVWPLALEPNLTPFGDANRLAAAGTIAADIVVVTLLLRVAFTPTVRLASFRMLFAAIAVTMIGDVLNTSPDLQGALVGRAVHSTYVLAFALAGAAMLTSSMRFIPTAAPPAFDPSYGRSVTILAAALVSPFVGAGLNQLVEHELDLEFFLAVGVVLAAVALGKIAYLFRRLDALRAEAAAAEQKFRMVFDSAGIGISLGSGGMMTETNEAYQRMLGYTRDELAGMHYTAISHPDDIGIDEVAAAEVAAGTRSSYHVEKRYVKRDGEVLWVNVTVTSARDGSFGIGMVEDISERRRLEQERKQLLARTVEVAEAERMALAADLHDGPIQHLTAVTLTLDLLANKLSRGEVEGAATLAHRLRESLAAEMRSLRRLMTELRPPILDERGLDAALSDSGQAILDGEPTRFELESDLRQRRLAPELETAVYRVVREALTNVRKHAQAHTARVTLVARAEDLELTVADDGAGFVPHGDNNGHVGLLMMRERVESLGGEWQLTAAPGEGTRIRATLPLKA